MSKNELRRKRRFGAGEREVLLGEYRRSGLTQYEFAARVGISVSCLSSWMRRARSGPVSEPVRFLELPRSVATSADATSSPALYTVWFPGGLKVGLAPGFVPAEAEQLCRMVRSL